MTILDRKIARRSVLKAFGASALAATGATLPFVTASQAKAASPEVQRIADHFSRVKSMTGEFVQFGPRGEQTGGKFSLARPGRIRFDYEAPAQFRVVSDGSHVLLNNRKLKTYETYPLSKTPLKMLLDERIDLSDAKVQSVKQDEDLTTIVLVDKSVFGNAKLTLMFDPQSFELRQWTITDAQGKDTTVMLFNVQEGAAVDPKLFTIDYSKVANTNAAGNKFR